MSQCPGCQAEVALHAGEPRVTARGVELWHRTCGKRPRRSSLAPMIAAVAPVIAATRAIPQRTIKVAGVAIGAATLVAIGFAQVAIGEVVPPPPAPSVAAIGAIRDVEVRTAPVVAHEQMPPRPLRVETPLEAHYQMPTFDGEPLDSKYPSLRGWTHPVTASKELMPELHARHFGSERVGIERAECGLGHCGVDLDAPEGRPLVAVADGKIVRIERSELGLDHLSGRYVRIQHDDGTLTAYMHMDDVAEELQTGDRVMAGQYIGTLGATAVYEAPPHCHFSLEIPNHPGQAGAVGDTTDTHYIDPAPFLVRSTIVPHGERRHPKKPAI